MSENYKSGSGPFIFWKYICGAHPNDQGRVDDCSLQSCMIGKSLIHSLGNFACLCLVISFWSGPKTRTLAPFEIDLRTRQDEVWKFGHCSTPLLGEVFGDILSTLFKRDTFEEAAFVNYRALIENCPPDSV